MLRAVGIIGGALLGTDAVARAAKASASYHGWALSTLWRLAWMRPAARNTGTPSLQRLWWAWAVYFSLAAGVACFALAALPGALRGDWSAVCVAVSLLSLAASAGIKAIAAGVTHWQVRNGRAGNWRDWWNDCAFVPPSSGGVASIALAICAAALLAPAAAYAAAVSVGAVETDFALRAIHTLFPSGDNSTPLTRGVHALSSLLLGGVAGVLAYQTFAALNHAAEHGKLSGEYGHNLSYVRFALAFGLLLPFGSGLNGGQRFVSYGLEWSSNFATVRGADFVADVLGVEQDGKPGTGHLGIPPVIGGTQVARQVLDSEACAIVQAWMIETSRELSSEGGAIAPPAEPGLPPARGEDRDGKLQVWNYARHGRCGALTLPSPADKDASALLTTYRRAKVDALAALVTAVRESELPFQLAAASMPNTGVEWPVDPLLPRLQAAAAAYDDALLKASAEYLAAAQRDGRESIVRAIKAQGWPTIGAVWSTLSAVNAAAVALASEPPGRREPDDVGLSADWARLQERLAREWTDETRMPELNPQALSEAGDKSASMLARLLNPLTRPLVQTLTRWAQTDDANPLHEGVTLGHWMTGAAEAAVIAGIVVAGGAGNVAAASLGGLTVFDWVSAFVKPWIWIAYGIGWVHAYLLPMLPYIAMTMAYITFLFALVELLIALPVLLFLAARLDGPEFVHAAFKPGLALVANAVARPVFTVFAFVSAYYLLPLALNFINKTFAAAFIGATGGHTLGIGGVMGSLILMAWLQWQAIVRILAATHEIPDRLLRYWGSHGTEGATEGRAAAMAAGAAMGAASSAGGSGGGSGGGGSGGGGISKLPKGGGGGGSVGIRPAGTGGGSAAGGGGYGGQAWFQQSGGLGGLNESQLASAQASFQEWAAENPRPAAKYGFDGYVAYAQEKQAEIIGS